MRALPVVAALAACIAGCTAPRPALDAPAARIEAPAFRAGESWSYDEIDPYRRMIVGTVSQTAAGGAQPQAFSAPYTKLPFPLEPGMHWSETIEAVDAHRWAYPWRIAGRAYGWERVRTPAGEFDALRIVHMMILGDGEGDWRSTTRIETLWYAPAVNGWVRVERRDTQREIKGMNPRSRDDWRIWELRGHIGG